MNWLINYNYLKTLLFNIGQLIDTQIKTSCIVSRAFIYSYLQMPKIKDWHVIFCNTVSKAHKKDRIYSFLS